MMFTPENIFQNAISGAYCKAMLNGREHTLTDADELLQEDNCITGDFKELGIKIKLEFEIDETQYSLGMNFENYGQNPVTIGDITLFSSDKNLDLGDAEREQVTFEFRDTLDFNDVCRVVDDKGEHWSKPLCLIYNPQSKKCFFAAQLTFEKNDVIFNSKFDIKSGVMQKLSCTMPIFDYELLPGTQVTTDKVIIVSGDKSPFALLENWADQVHDIYQPELPEKSFAGVTGGTLVDIKAELPEIKYQRNVKAVNERLKGLEVKYCWISIKNLKDGLPGNWLNCNKEYFPAGIPAMLKYIKDAGLKTAFWINPFYVTEGSDAYEPMKPYFIRNKDGEASVRTKWLWAFNASENAIPKTYALDAAKQETNDYIKNVFETYADWGISYYMLDFLFSGTYLDDEQSQGFGKEAYLKFMRKIQDYNAPDTHRLAATGSTLSHVGAVSSSRIGLDYCEGRSLLPRFPSYPANYVINGSFGSAGAPNRNAINNLACWYFAHDKFFQCNSNMMTVSKPIPLDEALITTTLFGISPSPVFFGDDLDQMSEERLALIKKVLPRCENMPIPVDLFTKTDVNEDFVRIFMLPIEKPWGKWYICAVFNLNDKFREVKLDSTLLQLEQDESYRMYDFWQETYCGEFKNETTIEVGKNSCKVFRFEATRKHPWILSTDIHVRQGDAELDNVVWDEEKMELSGEIKRPAGETGNLYLIAPEGYMERNFNRNLVVVKSALDNSLIIKKQIAFKQDCEDWKIEFARIEN